MANKHYGKATKVLEPETVTGGIMVNTVSATIVTEVRDRSQGPALSKGLIDDEMKSGVHTILVTIADHKAPEVTMSGFWDGRILSAAMRSIDKKYLEARKHSSVWAMRQSQKKEK